MNNRDTNGKRSCVEDNDCRESIVFFVQIPFEKPIPAGFHDPSMDRFDKDGNIQKVAFTIFSVCNF